METLHGYLLWRNHLQGSLAAHLPEGSLASIGCIRVNVAYIWVCAIHPAGEISHQDVEGKCKCDRTKEDMQYMGLG